MPQEFHIIRCYSCETFQVHIVKKSNKWECKMCGEKQSLKKVYFQGSGKDCRLNVQKLNEKRILNEVNKECPENREIEELDNENKIESEEINQNSKWDEFLPEKQESSDEDVEQSEYTFNRPNKRKSFNKKANKEKRIKVETEEIHGSNNPGPSKWKDFISKIENNTQNVNNEPKIITDNIKSKQGEQEINNPGSSKWKAFLSNIENNSQYVNTEQKIITDNKKSKWDCFVNNTSENEDDEIPNEPEINVSLNKDSKQSLSNIFTSDDNNLDDVLNL